MITEQSIDLSPAQRAALETLLAEQVPDCHPYAPRNAATWSIEDILDLEDRRLLEYAEEGTRVTAAGRQLVVDLAHEDAVRPPLPRRIRIENGGHRKPGRHALAEGAESTLPGLGVVLPSAAEYPRHELTEVIPPIAEPEPEWPTETGELDVKPVCTCTPEWCYVGDDVPDTALASECRVCAWLPECERCPAYQEAQEAQLLAEPEFFDGFEEAAEEHTAELEAIAAEERGWFRRNATIVRVAFVAACVGAALAETIGWLVR